MTTKALFAKKVVSATAVAILGGLWQGVEAMYQSDRGKNEWHVETLGEITDAVLFADS